MHISIRRLQIPDSQTIALLEKKVWEGIHTYSKEEIEERIKINKHGFLGYFEYDQLKGYIEGIRVKKYSHFNTWEEASSLVNLDHEGKIKYLSNVTVADPGKGIGSVLLNSYKIYARSLGIKMLTLGSRVPSYHFYKKLGFQDVKHIEKWWEVDIESGGKGILMKYKL